MPSAINIMLTGLIIFLLFDGLKLIKLILNSAIRMLSINNRKQITFLNLS